MVLSHLSATRIRIPNMNPNSGAIAPSLPPTITGARSIRFPKRKERIKGVRRGPRFRLTVNTAGLQGAALAAAGMVANAMRYRDSAARDAARLRQPGFVDRDGWSALSVRLSRNSMREAALWARRFAHSIAEDDPRWAEIKATSEPLRAALVAYCNRYGSTCGPR